MPHSILIVEDERDLANGVRDALTHAGYQADVCYDGQSGLERLLEGRYELAVLDLMLPGMNGLDVLKNLRKQRSDVRVLILTALSDEEHLLEGFQAGADDYMSKPFSPRAMVARVEAQFRRQALEGPSRPLMDLPGGVKIDLARLEVHRDGGLIPLTPREGDILEYLIRNRDRVVTRDDLLIDVWHYKSANVETRTVDIHIVGLRRKIEPDPAKPSLIQTVRGKGYRWFN
jgi:two-component system alkaline phosphatase synthesis response regulator PhoP